MARELCELEAGAARVFDPKDEEAYAEYFRFSALRRHTFSQLGGGMQVGLFSLGTEASMASS